MPFRADRLQQLQKNEGYTNRYIAIALDVNENTVSRWANGKRQPGKLSLNQLAAIFRVSMEFLLGVTDDPTPPSDEIEDLSVEERELLNVFRRGGRKALKRHLDDDDE